MADGYSVRYAIFHDAATGAGYWIRETFTAPATRKLWFIRTGVGPPLVKVADVDALPAGDRLVGRIGDVEWDVGWSPTRRGHSMIPWSLRAVGFTETRVTTEAPAARFSGRVAGADVKDAPGLVARICGRGYTRPWAWVFGCVWDPPLLVEALGSGRTVSFLAVAPRWTWRRNRIDALPANRTIEPPGPAGWAVGAVGFGRQARLRVKADPERFVRLEYVGPKGERMICRNTLHADAEFEVRTRPGFGAPWGEWRRHVAKATVAYEFTEKA